MQYNKSSRDYIRSILFKGDRLRVVFKYRFFLITNFILKSSGICEDLDKTSPVKVWLDFLRDFLKKIKLLHGNIFVSLGVEISPRLIEVDRYSLFLFNRRFVDIGFLIHLVQK